MHRIFRISLTAIVLILIVASLGIAAVKTVKKPVPTKAAALPKILTIAVGQPFEALPFKGKPSISLTTCADQIESATFSVSSGKIFTGVSAACGNLSGPGKILRECISVRLVQGDNLNTCNSLLLDSTPKQFWLNVSVPKNTKPGLYKGSIVFFANGKQFDSMPIELTVRALRLIGSSKQYVFYTSVGPDASTASYAQFLKNIAGMGFRSVSVSSKDSFAACASAGLVGMTPVLTFASNCSVPTIEDVRAVESARTSSRISSAFYFCACENEQDMQAALDKASVLRRAGVQVAATVCDDAAIQKLMPVVDGVNYKVDAPYVQSLVNGGANRTNKWEWYWWDSRQSVQQNRINAGIGLWRSGLYGCMPMWIPKDALDRADNLNSLLCEALREGINDTRYITTYMKALRELKDKKRSSDKDYIASTETYLANFLQKPLDKITPADLRDFRSKMAQFSTKLAAML